MKEYVGYENCKMVLTNLECSAAPMLLIGGKGFCFEDPDQVKELIEDLIPFTKWNPTYEKDNRSHKESAMIIAVSRCIRQNLLSE